MDLLMLHSGIPRREDSQWLSGLFIAFFWLFAINFPLAHILARSRWPDALGALALSCSIALLVVIARSYHRQSNSWAWARGAIIGGTFPIGIALLQFTMHYQ